jgi:hypothetical protein
MQRVREQLGGRRLLHDAPRIHDRDAVRLLRDDAQVVRDEHDAHAAPAAKAAQQVEDLGLDRHVERRSSARRR